jgi:hypothetical protein
MENKTELILAPKERVLTDESLWLDTNMIYCEDTHSFVHRMFDRNKAKPWEDYHSAQHDAFEVLDEMRAEYKEKFK